MMDSVDAKKLLGEIFDGLPAHRRKEIEEITYLDLGERVHHLKIMIKIKPVSEEKGCMADQEQDS